MPEDELAISLGGERVVALAERALYWPTAGTLFVADVHFGKDATFRQARRWVPPGTTEHDLERLARLIERHDVRRLVILGDAFHSEHAEEPATVEELLQWRARVPIEILMVRGNHDRRVDAIAERLQFSMEEEGALLAPWSLHHHPATSSDNYVLCGHVHPVILARGGARQRLRLPCFWADDQRCILPAFGGFTGGGLVKPRRGDQVVVVAGDRVMLALTEREAKRET